MLTKAILRANFLEKRRALSRKERLHASRAICHQVEQAIDWQTIHSVHIYTASTALGEVDTTFLLDYLRAEQPGIAITQGEPHAQAKIPAQQFDLIIVPLVAFDDSCHRLGMGGGWYDRFLATQPQAQTVGLAYSLQYTADIPHEPHDIPLKLIATETALYTAKNPPSTTSSAP